MRSPWAASNRERVVKFAILAGMAVLTFPPTFIARGSDLDAGWMYALNRAWADGLRFGRDFAFTYGPLGFIAYPMDVGENLALAAVGRVGLSIVWLVAVTVLAWPAPWRRAVPFIVVAALAALPVHSDASSLDQTGMTLCAVVYLLVAASARQLGWPAALAGALTGVAVFIKSNIGWGCLAALCVYAVTEAASNGRLGRRRAAVALTVSGLTIGLLGGALFDWSVEAARGHVRSTYLLTEGYSSHMALHPRLYADYGVGPELIAAAAVVAGIAVVGAARTQPDLWADALILTAPLFSLYKSAVVRCDAGHWRPALLHAFALLAVIVIRGRSRAAQALGIAIGSAAVCVLLDAVATEGLAHRFSWGVRAMKHLATWSDSRAELSRAEQAGNVTAAKEFPRPTSRWIEPPLLPWLSSLGRKPRTDVYPFMLLYARDGHLNWRPRYTPQPYLAYHPRLDAASAETYRRPDGPAYVIYHHEAIDYYQPFAVDPLTMTELIRWYEPECRLDESHLLLRRRATPSLNEPRPIGRGVIQAGKPLSVPPAGPEEYVFLKLFYTMTFPGRFAAFAYRVNPPILRFKYSNGLTNDAQIPWRNAASGFPINPFPLDIDAAEAVFAGGQPAQVTTVTPHPHSAFASDIPFEWLKATRR